MMSYSVGTSHTNAYILLPAAQFFGFKPGVDSYAAGGGCFHNEKTMDAGVYSIKLNDDPVILAYIEISEEPKEKHGLWVEGQVVIYSCATEEGQRMDLEFEEVENLAEIIGFLRRGELDKVKLVKESMSWPPQ